VCLGSGRLLEDPAAVERPRSRARYQSSSPQSRNPPRYPARQQRASADRPGARPQATALGKDAYSSLDAKAAPLLHSLARNHALIDGNKRLALAAVIAFYGLNGRRLTFTNDEAYELVMKVAAGKLDQVEEISAVLRAAPRPAGNEAAFRPESHPGTWTVVGSSTRIAPIRLGRSRSS